jgi:hypothetical protein
MKIIDSEDRTSQNSWFAVEDINRRAAAAYQSNPQFFDDPVHQARCATVESLMRQHVRLVRASYVTARKATRNQPVHSEVKLDRVEFDRGRRAELLKKLLKLGIAYDDITYKPATESISVRVK